WLVDGMAQFASLLYSEQTLSPAELQERVNKALVKALSYEGTTAIRQAVNLDKDSPDYRSLIEYKGAFVFRMLLWVIGDENFNKLLSQYVQQFQNTPASTEAFEKLASDVAGGDLGYFFDQWLNGSGVPEFKLEYTVFRMKDGYKVLGQVKQDLDLFRMPVEFQIQTDGDPEYARVDVVGPSSEFEAKTERKPKWVEVWASINRGNIFDIRGPRERAVTEYQKASNTGDDSYGAQGEADKYVKEPFRRAGKTTIG